MIGSNFVWVKWPIVAKTLGGFGVLVSVIILANEREQLLKNNMFDVENYDTTAIVCDARSQIARTEDGTCNNPENAAMGSAYVRFGRNVPLAEAHGESTATLLTPNPREISRQLMTREAFKPATTLNFIAAAWIQFMVHDWVSHGEKEIDNPILVPLAEDDPFGQEHLAIQRTRRDPTRSSLDDDRPATYQNVNTHWWDGSQIYGSDLATSNAVRAFKGGRLEVTEDNRLPTNLMGVPIQGFTDNWWLGLSLMHHLFVLEHNAIADSLAAKYPDMSDQALYDKARLINAALMAKIHTIEWTPAILANPVTETTLNANWWGIVGEEKQEKFQEKVRRLVKSLNFIDWITEFTTGWDPELSDKIEDLGSIERALGGLVGARNIAIYDVPYTLTEEFVAVYRMHPLLRDNIDVFSMADNSPLASIPLVRSRDSGAENIMDDFGIDTLWYSFGVTHPGALTLNNYPQFLQGLDMPLLGKIDLATIDVVRDRERGVPRYNQFRRLIGLKPINKFEDLTKDPETLAKLKTLYNNDVELIDTLVGQLAETVRPDGFGFGETAFQIFILNASRRLMTDRFYTVDFRDGIYTPEGMDWIKRTTMVDVLQRHFPALADKMGDVKNAFKPW